VEILLFVVVRLFLQSHVFLVLKQRKIKAIRVCATVKPFIRHLRRITKHRVACNDLLVLELKFRAFKLRSEVLLSRGLLACQHVRLAEEGYTAQRVYG
jgi:hypothetical protein